MKWGVRRYQNPDGSLTSAGKKRYGKMSGERLYKTLKKQVRNKRQEDSGFANKFMTHKPIGKESKKLVEERSKQRKEYESSKEYKDWLKKVNTLERKYENATDVKTINRYDSEWEKLMKAKPAKSFNDIKSVTVYGKTGRNYVDDFINKGGKDMSMAYLKDLGYSDEVAKDFVKRMAKSNRTLGAI